MCWVRSRSISSLAVQKTRKLFFVEGGREVQFMCVLGFWCLARQKCRGKGDKGSKTGNPVLIDKNMK